MQAALLNSTQVLIIFNEEHDEWTQQNYPKDVRLVKWLSLPKFLI